MYLGKVSHLGKVVWNIFLYFLEERLLITQEGRVPPEQLSSKLEYAAIKFQTRRQGLPLGIAGVFFKPQGCSLQNDNYSDMFRKGRCTLGNA